MKIQYLFVKENSIETKSMQTGVTDSQIDRDSIRKYVNCSKLILSQIF